MNMDTVMHAISGSPGFKEYGKKRKPNGLPEMQEKETAPRVLVLRHTDAPGDASGIGWLDLDALPTEEDRTRMEDRSVLKFRPHACMIDAM